MSVTGTRVNGMRVNGMKVNSRRGNVFYLYTIYHVIVYKTKR